MKPKAGENITGLAFAFGIVVFAFSMVAFPKEVFQASLRGLDAWWNIVFPALLPFFVVSNLMMSFGIVHFLGVLLEPIMKPIFNVPGNGAFVMAMGYTSGFPIGSVLTADLRKNNLCTRFEGERLISFTNNASPLFMFGAVSIGMFDNAQIGTVIAAAHYCANVTMGLLLRYHGYNDPEASACRAEKSGLLQKSVTAMLTVQKNNKRPLGQLLGDAVKKSVATLTTVGGFIILFSVILQVLSQLGIIPVFSEILEVVLTGIGLDSKLSNSLSAGLFEVTLGSKIASETAVPLSQQLIAISLVLGWSGLSVHAQVASIISSTDLRLWPFVVSRIGHALIAGIYIGIFLGPVYPALSGWDTPLLPNVFWQLPWLASLLPLLLSCLLLTAVTIIAVAVQIRRNIFGFRVH